LKPYQKNTGKRLVKSPKVYFRDTGLLHALLRLKNFEDLAAHPIVGASWEGFVVEQIINLAGPRFESFYYRTQAGAEVDLVLVSNRQRIAVEVKFSLSPDLTRGFWNAMEDLKCKHAYLVYPGKETYPVSKNVSVVPVSELQKILA
jgi:predicted AAA+ superfamily ATPase